MAIKYKIKSISIREDHEQKLKQLAEQTGLNESAIIRLALATLFAENKIKKQMEEKQTISNKEIEKIQREFGVFNIYKE